MFIDHGALFRYKTANASGCRFYAATKCP